MAASDLVEPLQQGCRGEPFPVHRHGIPPLKLHLHVLRGIGGFLGVHGHAEHPLGGFGPGVLEDPSLVGNMQEIGVHGIRFLLGHGNGDAVGLRIGDHLLPALEAPLPPGGDHPDVGLQGVGGELKAHLVVALARGSVGDGLRPFLLGDPHQVLGDEGPGDGGAEEVVPLVHRARAEHGEDEVPHELFP